LPLARLQAMGMLSDVASIGKVCAILKVVRIRRHKISRDGVAVLPDLARLERYITPAAGRSGWRLRMRRHLLLIAEHDNAVIGFALAYIGRQSMHIVGLAIDIAYRRQGVASRLLRAIERYAGQSRSIKLEARTDNGPALALYRKHGYREDVCIKRFYADGADAVQLVMGS
jgi:ribosomal protein S18 acetylase RimI-like enzyme